MHPIQAGDSLSVAVLQDVISRNFIVQQTLELSLQKMGLQDGQSQNS